MQGVNPSNMDAKSCLGSEVCRKVPSSAGGGNPSGTSEPFNILDAQHKTFR
jgi:hypothetical protein